MLTHGSRRVHGDRPRPLVLILSHDALAAALLGGLVETLGFRVAFAQPPETAEASVRRARPGICFVDCEDPRAFHTEFVGRATMRGLCVVIFGTKTALDRVRAIVMAHDVATLTMPPELEALEVVLHKAGADD